jgi:TolB-like protein/AraC-like DNA-binding protein
MSDPRNIDQVFIKKLKEIVFANLADENFDVEKLAKLAGMSRSSIHRKLRSLRNRNVSQFIREIRLQCAMEMLQHNIGTSSEIAYKVGFGSPTYFNKCFHEFFGYPPGEVKKRVLPGDEESVKTEGDVFQESQKVLSVLKASPLSGNKIRRNRLILIASFCVGIIILAWVLFSQLIHGKDAFGGSNARASDLSVVVLPFKNFSEDPNNQYFADGIMEDILSDLYLISDLRVISRTTSERIGETSLTAKEIARKVDAHNVLEGSVRRYGNKVRISVQLIDAQRDQHLWSANFDRELNDIIGIQGDIALQVAQNLNAVISEKEISQIGRTSTRNTEAYDLYLKGRFLLHKANSDQRSDFNKEGVMGCIPYFEKAIAADPNFADAYAGLANAMFNAVAWGMQTGFEGIIKARDLSMKALEIDPGCAEAHAVKGAVNVWFERRFEEGRKEFQTAVQLNPNFATIHQWYAQLLMITGPIEEARMHMDRALELEPYFWVEQNLNAWIYYFEEKNDKAIEACVMARDLKPDFSDNKWLFFLNYAKMGEGDKAAKVLQSIAGTYRSDNQYDDEILAALTHSGIEGLFLWLIDINIHKPIPVDGMNGHPFYISWWYAILGKREESIYWLEKNMKTNPRLYTYFNLIATNPDFDILRNDPRFLSILDEIGLAPYNTRPVKIR